ncbi:MAG: AmmeMemoRadiSam system protein B, partial [Candidatus Omnitrophica bacterium]|nr:AmmeMemoRadiSam system protein B [Candidatus Omnitrophota bacterium]
MRKSILFFFIFCFLIPAAYATEIKYPNVAGQFYPAAPKDLSQKIQYFLNNTKSEQIDGEILALISPHAGYDFSGSVAAYGYKAIEGRHYDVVVVLALSHRQDIAGVAIWPKGEFNTPLGNIPVDEILSKQLQELNSNIKDNPSVF